MAEKIFEKQVNYGWGLSLNMTGKAPAVAKRIFNTLADAQAFADDFNDSAIEGLVLSVVADDADKNGVYFVQSIKTSGSTESAVLVKLGSASDAADGADSALGEAKAYTNQEVKKLADGAVSANTKAIATLNGDVKTEGSVAKAVATEKARAEAAESDLTDAIDAETTARTAADNAINAKIGDIESGTTIVEMIEEAEAAARAAATTIGTKLDGHVRVSVSQNDSTSALTYTISEYDIASAKGLQDEIDRAVATEASLQAQIGQAATEASGATGLHKEIADVKAAYEAAIEAMCVTITGDGDFVDVTVKQVDGVITEVTVAESDIASANDLTAETTARTAADTALDNRLTKIEGDEQTVGSIKKAVKDAKDALLDNASEKYNTLGKLEDRIIEVSSAAKTYRIDEVVGDELTSLGANVKEAYKLVEIGDTGNTKVGEYIKVYKDSSLQEVELVGQELQFTYLLASGQTSTVSVDVSNFLAESEFKDGLQVVDHVVSVKRDAASEDFLTVSADGIKLSGVQTAINNAITDETQNRTNAINALDATVGTTTVENGKHVAVQVVETAGKLTSLVVTEDDIASADELKALKDVVGNGFTTGATVANKIADNAKAITDEANTRKADDDAINAKIGDIESGTTIVEMINEAKAAAIAASTVVSGASEFITVTKSGEVGKTQTYTITTQDVASESATTAAIYAEEARALAAESGLTSAIDTEVQTRASEDTAIKGRLTVLEGVTVTGENAIVVDKFRATESKVVSLKLGKQPAEGEAGIVLSQDANGLVAKLQWGTF